MLASAVALLATPNDRQKGKLEEVAGFPDRQVTGVAVSKDERVFVSFPYWSDNHTISVGEVMRDGTLKPYPDEPWNAKSGDPAQRWVCVQSVYIDDQDTLWVLDPAAPKMEKVVKGGAKLVRFDLTKNKVVHVIRFEEDFAPEGSYLNDVRIDTKTQHAYITDSGLGALVIVDLKSGGKRRVLENHPATKAQPGVTLEVDEIQLKDPKTGQTPQVHADGIALDRENGYLYIHALTGHTLYRIKTTDLRDAGLSEEQLSQRVEKVADTPASDGMIAGRDGSIYLTTFEHNAIARW